MGIRLKMRQFIKNIFIGLSLLLLNNLTYSGPWFTGPLLAPAGHVVPNGHTNFEIYGLNILTNGSYDEHGNIMHIPLFRTLIGNPILSHGFADWLDIQTTVPYTLNATQGVHSSHISDVAVSAGFQLLEQKSRKDHFDLRFVVQESIPTGRYDHLNPALLGTDATGLGAYQTQMSLNLQYLLPVFETHYLRTRFIVSRLFGTTVKVDGLSSFGGTEHTHGKVKVGHEYNVDLAFEYTLTQNWVAVMEGYISKGADTRFNGILDLGNIGSPPITVVASGAFIEKALAPAIEYNFNQNIGIIGGVWFPLSGINTPHYFTYVLALNAYW